MTHPASFPLACTVFRLCGYGVEVQGEDLQTARVIDVPSNTPLGTIDADGGYHGFRIPERKHALVGRFVACVLDFCSVARVARVPLPEFPPATTGGAS